MGCRCVSRAGVQFETCKELATASLKCQAERAELYPDLLVEPATCARCIDVAEAESETEKNKGKVMRSIGLLFSRQRSYEERRRSNV